MTYPLVSYPSIFGIPLIYLSYISVLYNYIDDEPPFKLNKFMFFYNSFQILFNLFMVCGFMFTNYYELFIYIHYLSKYIDYIDTIIIVLRKKDNQLTFLHLFHHSTINIPWGIMLNANLANEISYFGCFINSFIHFVMYSHYLYSSFGYVNPYKKYITKAQITQFVLCILNSIYIIAYKSEMPAIYPSLQLFYCIIMIVLFQDFYKKKLH